MFIYSKCKCLRKPKKYKYTDTQLNSFGTRLKLIAVKARIQIILLLAVSPHCVCDIMAHTGFSQSLVSHHLADLMKACFVGYKKDGKYVEYFLNDNGRELLKIIRHVGACCGVGTKKGGDAGMKQDKNDFDNKKKCCNEDEKECCGGEAGAEEMSKKDLLILKSKLEESLKEVNEALAKRK